MALSMMGKQMERQNQSEMSSPVKHHGSPTKGMMNVLSKVGFILFGMLKLATFILAFQHFICQNGIRYMSEEHQKPYDDSILTDQFFEGSGIGE